MINIFTEILFFFILINPVSKIVVVNMLPHRIHNFQIEKLLIKSALVGWTMLVAFAFAGTFILNNIFQIRIEALQLAGGIILSIMGFRSLDKGIMFNVKLNKSLLDMAIVPLASPLIAGPATLAATIVKSSIYSPFVVSAILFISISLIVIVAISSLKIKNILDKYNLMGSLIRITGLFILAMGLHMIMISIESYFWPLL